MSAYKWSRRVKRGQPYFEVSTKGDRRFSSLIARLKNGFTVEEIYQLEVKGYKIISTDWKVGKGKPPLTKLSKEDLYIAYKKIWQMFFKENPLLLKDIALRATDKTITDMFATSEVNQAHAICDILNDEVAKESKKELMKGKKK